MEAVSEAVAPVEELGSGFTHRVGAVLNYHSKQRIDRLIIEQLANRLTRKKGRDAGGLNTLGIAGGEARKQSQRRAGCLFHSVFVDSSISIS